MCSKPRFSAMRWLKGQMMKRMPAMLTCREFEEFIISYLDGDLPLAQSRVFKMHLLMCRECREYLDAYKRSIELNQSFLKDSEDSIPESVPDTLIKAIVSSTFNRS